MVLEITLDPTTMYRCVGHPVDIVGPMGRPQSVYEVRPAANINLSEYSHLIHIHTYKASRQKVGRIGNMRGSGHVTPGGSARKHIWTKQTPEMEQAGRARIKNAQGKFQTPSMFYNRDYMQFRKITQSVKVPDFKRRFLRAQMEFGIFLGHF